MPEIVSLLALDIRKSMLYRPVIEEPYLRPAALSYHSRPGWIYGIRFPSEKASACPIFVNESLPRSGNVSGREGAE
jgi:hypothetical protein